MIKIKNKFLLTQNNNKINKSFEITSQNKTKKFKIFDKTQCGTLKYRKKFLNKSTIKKTKYKNFFKIIKSNDKYIQNIKLTKNYFDINNLNIYIEKLFKKFEIKENEEYEFYINFKSDNSFNIFFKLNIKNIIKGVILTLKEIDKLCNINNLIKYSEELINDILNDTRIYCIHKQDLGIAYYYYLKLSKKFKIYYKENIKPVNTNLIFLKKRLLIVLIDIYFNINQTETFNNYKNTEIKVDQFLNGPKIIYKKSIGFKNINQKDKYLLKKEKINAKYIYNMSVLKNNIILNSSKKPSKNNWNLVIDDVLKIKNLKDFSLKKYNKLNNSDNIKFNNNNIINKYLLKYTNKTRIKMDKIEGLIGTFLNEKESLMNKIN